jgi:type II secretory pathway pseudopilin PulG
MNMQRSRVHGASQRASFTLLELVIVITIILSLITLGAAAAMRFIGVQQRSVTETTISKVYSLLDRAWKAVVSDALKEPIPSQYSNTVLQLAGNNSRRARVIWVKLRLMQQFPTSYYEILNPQILPSPYKTALSQVGITTAVGPYANPPLTLSQEGFKAESSACLLLALSEARQGINISPDDLGAITTGDVNGDGLREILDGWGRPIVYYRWPWGNPDVTSLNPALPGSRQYSSLQPQVLGNSDPQDPEGLLMDPNWWNTLGGPAPRSQLTAFENAFHLVSFSNPGPAFPSWPQAGNPGQWNLTGPFSYYTIPVVASAGADGVFGLDRTVMGPDPNLGVQYVQYQNDNIYSYRIRLGGSSN